MRYLVRVPRELSRHSSRILACSEVRPRMHRRFLALSLFATAALALAASPARGETDAVQFFNNIEVTPDAPVNDAVCFFCNVDAHGEVRGDIVVLFGNVRLDGQAHQDVVNFFGNVTAADNSAIGGDLVSFFGSIRLGENVRVNQDMVAMFGTVRAPASVSIGQDHVVFSPWVFFGPFLVIFAIVFFIVHEIRVRRDRRFMQAYPVPPPPRV